MITVADEQESDVIYCRLDTKGAVRTGNVEDWNALDDTVRRRILGTVNHGYQRLHIHNPLIRLRASMHRFDLGRASRPEPRERLPDRHGHDIAIRIVIGLAKLPHERGIVRHAVSPDWMPEARIAVSHFPRGMLVSI